MLQEEPQELHVPIELEETNNLSDDEGISLGSPEIRDAYQPMDTYSDNNRQLYTRAGRLVKPRQIFSP